MFKKSVSVFFLLLVVISVAQSDTLSFSGYQWERNRNYTWLETPGFRGGYQIIEGYDGTNWCDTTAVDTASNGYLRVKFVKRYNSAVRNDIDLLNYLSQRIHEVVPFSWTVC